MPWLSLASIDGSTNGLTAVYRVLTRGGIAPPTCSFQAPGAVVTVKYTAQYYAFA